MVVAGGIHYTDKEPQTLEVENREYCENNLF